MLVITVAAFAVIVAASQSGGDIHSSDAHADSAEALYLAETGVERALKRFASGVAVCGAVDPPGPVTTLAETITNLSQLGLSGERTIQILDGLTSDFAGTAFRPQTVGGTDYVECRVRVTATVGSSGASRTIHAVVSRNLLEGPNNPTFNNPTTNVAPSGWTLNPAAAFAFRGGHEGTAPNCGRSAWHIKTQIANVASRAQLNTTVAFSVAAASTTTVSFHWRFNERTGVAGCPAGVASGPAWPAACGGVVGEGQVCFRFNPAGAGGVVVFNRTATPAVAVACPDPGTPSVFAPCSSQYQVEVPPTLPAPVAYPDKQSVTMAMGGGNVTSFLMNIRLQGANRREIFIDHLEATNTTATGAAQVRVWRDCSTMADPVNCT